MIFSISSSVYCNSVNRVDVSIVLNGMAPELLTAMFAEHGLEIERTGAKQLVSVVGHPHLLMMSESEAIAFIRGVHFQKQRTGGGK
jgi:hypothetical protein